TCGNSARTDLCGEPPARTVPTATVHTVNARRDISPKSNRRYPCNWGHTPGATPATRSATSLSTAAACRGKHGGSSTPDQALGKSLRLFGGPGGRRSLRKGFQHRLGFGGADSLQNLNAAKVAQTIGRGLPFRGGILGK